MQKHQYVDLSVGVFMLAGLAAMLILAMKIAGLSGFSTKDTYTVTAYFSNIGGLKVRAPVTVAGVTIGEVAGISLQPGSLNAKVTLQLRKDKPIPYEDATARILTQGLLGSNYISLVPGFEEDAASKHLYLRNGDEIPHTQEAMILENLIGQLVFNMNSKK
ncbi:MAG: outer membrane lipid asymmetry maintenance protein MlaD [Gammaproteobacteria bacterium]|nr:outer membrane lipid asymmetry maintenance protein MlaD [Gammaproteobacteria bacterium]